MATTPRLSVVVLAWDQLHHTRRCVESIRAHTDVDYELVIVDNGSMAEAATFASDAADVAVMHDRNTGFAHGMNSGLERARGEIVAFVNNDTIFPPAWARPLLAHLDDPTVGAVVPAVTAAADDRIVREEPGEGWSRLDPFDLPPPAVVILMRAEVMRALGGWDERYEVASGEDLDLSFTLWTNDLDIVLDERVLITHESKGTAAAKLDDWQSLWIRNRGVFLDRWTSADLTVPRLGSCPEAEHARNTRTARAAAGWMRRYFAALHRPPAPSAAGARGAGSWLFQAGRRATRRLTARRR